MERGLNYQKWRELHSETLESFSEKTALVMFSGGKDSSVMLHFMQQSADDFGFRIIAPGASYPHHVLTNEERFRLAQYWENRGISIDWQITPESDNQMSEALVDGISPCLICNTNKKKQVAVYLKSRNLDIKELVIVMGYSLWDLVSATVEFILGNSYATSDSKPALQGKNSQERYMETFQRFYPYLEMDGGLSIFKPLIFYNDQEILEVIDRESIPITRNACKFKEHRPKRLFAQYYVGTGLEFNYQNVLDFAKKNLGLPDRELFSRTGAKEYLKTML